MRHVEILASPSGSISCARWTRDPISSCAGRATFGNAEE